MVHCIYRMPTCTRTPGNTDAFPVTFPQLIAKQYTHIFTETFILYTMFAMIISRELDRVINSLHDFFALHHRHPNSPTDQRSHHIPKLIR